MAETKKRTTARGRGASATKSTLEQLLAARDEVDAETVSLREREEAVLASFAQATVDRDAVIAARDAELAKLEKRATTIREQAEPKLAGIDERVAVTLLQLTELGRNAEQVAKMTGVPVKKVRSMIRDARKAASDESRTGAGSKPADSRAASSADTPAAPPAAKETTANS